MADHVFLEAGDDLVRQLSHEREAVKAVLELVWNALDADATNVQVAINRTPMDAVDKVIVEDNGEGITPEEARSAFKKVGNSWKQNTQITRTRKRPLHGKAGRGRLRAFALGNSTRWTSVANAVDGTLMCTTIESEISKRTEWDIDSQPATDTLDTGTRVELWGKQSRYVDRLLEPKAVAQITAGLAPYLLTFKDVRVTYDGKAIDPRTHVRQESWEEDLAFEFEGETQHARLRLIEWHSGSERTIALCDAANTPVETIDAATSHTDFSYTAYVLWEPMPRHRNEVDLISLGGETPLKPLLKAARAWIASHFEDKRRRQRRLIVDGWINERVYPYPTHASSDEAQAEQSTFDLVATSIHRHIPAERTKKKLTLSLLQNSLRHDPDAMIDILGKVLQLDPADATHLHGLLQQTSLSNIIRASSLITARLDFLTVLEHLVYDEETYGLVKERDHLHKILERELWVFGEEYNMMTSSEIGMTRVLEHHRRAVGMDPTPDGPVRLVGGRTGRVDLMLSAESRDHDRVRHLVVELKAPSVEARREQVAQIEDYMEAVVAEPRFANVNTTWDFYLLVRTMDDKVKTRARQRGKPEGLISDPDGKDHAQVRVWVRTWSEILQDAKQRLEFVKKGISHNPSLEQALEYLRTRHGDLIPDQLHRDGTIPYQRGQEVDEPAV